MSDLRVLRTDFTNLRRDPMLVAAGLAPLLVAGLVALGFDPLAAALAGSVTLDRALFVAGALALTPLLIGFVVGFLLVEEREERILEAVAVTPHGTTGFLRHRLALPAVVGAAAAGLLGWLIGGMEAPRLLVVVLLAGGTATLVAMTLVAIARDRVQALAVSKLIGFLLVGAVGFQFVAGWWRVPLGLLPPTWLIEAAVGPTVGRPLLLGVITHLGAGLLLWPTLGRIAR